MKLKEKITELNNDKTIKEILKTNFNISNRLIIKLKKYNQIFCNDIPCYVNKIVKKDDIVSIEINFSEEENDNIIPIPKDIAILYEDESLIILNKPANMPTHPSNLHYSDTISNYLKYYFNSKNIFIPIRPINRLDKDTSGIIIFAKNSFIQESLIKQMKNNTFKKEYICIVNGILKRKNGTIDLPIARKDNSIIERCVNTNGKKAITHYTVLQEFENYSLVNVVLETGRTHQIRVHFSYLHHPLIGDDIYGDKSNLLKRQALHCSKISFIHPITKKEIKINCDIPDDIKSILK